MANFSNLSGTTISTFKIGKGGVTIHQGSSQPGTAENGDFWFDTSGQLYARIAGSWQLVKFDNISISGNTISSTNTNGNIILSPDGTGNLVLGNYTLDGDQSVGVGQDNYVLTYNNSTGLISLEDATASISLTGDVTGSGSTNSSIATTIANNAVSNTKLRDSAGLSVIGRGANSTGDPADIVAGTDGHVLRRSGTTLSFGQIATGGIANNAVTLAKLSDITTASFIGRSSGGTGDPEVLSAATAKTILAISSADISDVSSSTSDRARANHTGTQLMSTISDAGALATLSTVGTSEIDNEAVTLAKIQHIATDSFLGRDTTGTGDVEVLSASAAKGILNITAADISDVETSASDRARANHTGTQLMSTISDAGNLATLNTVGTTEIDNNAVTFDKLEDVAEDRILGRVSTGAGNAEELTAAQVRTLLNVADGAEPGTVTSIGITPGDLVDVTGSPVTTSGNITVSVDLSELPDGTGAINGAQDEIVYLDNGTQRRKLVSEWALSAFDNDVGWTTNTGTVTSVAISGSDGIQIDSGSPITTSGTIALGIDAAALRTHINVENNAAADQNLFETFTITDTDSGFTWSETGSVVAGTTTDTLTFVSGSGIDLDVDPTSGAIRIDSTLAGGTVTSVSAGNGMDFTTITGSGSVTLGTPSSITSSSTNSVTSTSHTHALANESVTLAKIQHIATDSFLGRDTAGTGGVEVLSAADARAILNVADGAEPGTVTSIGITAGSLIDVSGSPVTTSGNITIDVDLSELPDGTSAIVGTDEIVYLDAGTQRRKAINEWTLSTFNNDAGWTSNTGTVTSVAISGTDGIQIDSGSPITTSGTITLGLNYTTLEGNLNHDNLVGFVGNEHIDWTNATQNLDTAGNVSAGNITISANTISSTNTNGDINLTPNGTGQVVIGNASSTSSLTAPDNADAVIEAGAATSGFPGADLFLRGGDGAAGTGVDGNVIIDQGNLNLSSNNIINGGTITATSFVGDLTGNADTATTWETGRTISLTGNVTGTSGTFDGSGNASITATIANEAVTLAKIQHIATDRLLGRTTAGTGDVEILTAAQVRTILNVADGAQPGTVTAVTAGTGLDSSGGTAPNITLNLSELPDGTGGINGSQDEIIYLDNGVQRRKQVNEWALGQFNNDQGWTSNTGTVTSVAVSGSDGIEIDSGSPITGAGTITLGINAAALRSHINVENNAAADQNLFETFTVTDTDSGYTWSQTGSAVAGTTTDTLTFVSGTGIDLDIDTTAGAIRIESTLAGGTVTSVSAGNGMDFTTITGSGPVTLGTPSSITSSSTNSTTSTSHSHALADEAVTLAKLQHIATDSFLGRTTAATGDVEVLSATAAKSILNISSADISDVNSSTSDRARANHTGTQLMSTISDAGNLATLNTVGTTEIDNNAVTFDKLQDVAEDRIIGRVSTGAGNAEELTAAQVKTLLSISSADISDVSSSTSDRARANHTGTQTLATISDSGTLAGLNSVNTGQIDNEAVTLAKIQHIATDSFLGRATAATGDVEVLTASQAKGILNISSADISDVSSSTSDRARANHTGTQTLATISDSGALAALNTVGTSEIDNNAVTFAKLEDIAEDRIVGRISTGAGDAEELTAAQVRTIINVADGANNYTHPTFAGDDINIDTGPLTGAVVISDLDFNITTNTEGHVTDANGSVATRTLTLADLGYSDQNLFETFTVTDTDSGYTWTGTGSAVADSATDTLTIVSGSGINIDVDAANDAIRITSTLAGGTVTEVTVGTGLDVTNGTTTPDITLDLSELPDGTSAINGAQDEIIYLDNGTQRRKQVNEWNLGQFNNDQGWTSNTGTVTSVGITAGALIDVSGSPVTTSGNITIDVDLSELPDGTAAIVGTDEIVYLDAGVQRRKAINEWNLSVFNNDAGWTDNTGTVTSVSGGNGLTGTVTTSGSITMGTPSTLNGSTTNAVTASSHTHAIDSASLTVQGVVELATVTETNAGTDATRAVTPDGLNGWTGSGQIVTLGTITSSNVIGATPLDQGNIDVDNFTGWDSLTNNISTTGTISSGGAIEIESISTLTADQATFASTSQQTVAQFPTATYAGGDFVVTVSDSVTGERQITKLLITHDGTTAVATEYGIVHTGSAALADFDVDINGGNVRLRATAVASNSTEYSIHQTLLEV